MRAFTYLALVTAAAIGTPAIAADFVYTGPSVEIPGDLPLGIPNILNIGPASVFPLTFNVSGLGAITSDVNLTLFGLNHTFADDVAIALEGPTGLRILLLTDAGGWSNFNGNYTFDQSGTVLASGNYGNFNTVIDDSNPIAPSVHGFNPFTDLLTDGSSLAQFNGLDPNGIWKLWIADDSIGNDGSLTGATLSITAADAPSPAVPEPATWALMISGFALVGTAMRRSKTAVSFA